MNDFFNYLKCGTKVKLAEHVSSFERRFANLGEDCQAQGRGGWFCYKRSLNLSAQMIYRWHFGFRGKLVPRQVLGKGVEMAQAYFRLTGERLAKTTPDTEWTAEGTGSNPIAKRSYWPRSTARSESGHSFPIAFTRISSLKRRQFRSNRR